MVVIPILIDIPIIIGLILAYKNYGKDASKGLSYTIVCFAISRILSIVYYISLVGTKKGLKFLAVYVMGIILAYLLIIW